MMAYLSTVLRMLSAAALLLCLDYGVHSVAVLPPFLLALALASALSWWTLGCGNKPIAVDTIMATECACVQAWWRVCAPGRCVCAPSAWFVRAGVVRVSSACVRAACACVVHGWLCTSQSVARV